MPTSMKASLAAPVSPSLTDQISYINGVTSTGMIAAISSQTWNGDGPDPTSPNTVATYNQMSSGASKWAPGGPSAGASAIGSAGGTQYYYFDPASSFTAAQKVALASGLQLWSAVANIKFAEITAAAAAANPSLASLDFKSTPSGGTFEGSGNGTREPIGSHLLNNQGAGTYLTVNIDPNNGGFDLGNFNNGGSGVGVILHEEGHFLGLGHSGPYNGNADPATQQFSAYDSHEYSLMSYLGANDPAEKYAGSNPNPGATNYGDSTTWMPLDILAVQGLYGAATSGPLSGGQVFGYHDNVSGLVAGVGIHDFFDFSVITTPVVTLYDTGTGNTLDLSGDHSAETIDLRAGHYSSFAGDIDNLAIAYNTAIDTFVGGTAGTNVTVNADADTIKDTGTGNIVDFSGTLASYALNVVNAAELTVANIATGISDVLDGVQTLVFSDQTVQTATLTQVNQINGPAGGGGYLNGTPGVDVITAFGKYNAIFGHGGADIINAGAGNAYVDVAGGAATVTLGGDYNAVVGGNGNVTVKGAPGGNTAAVLGNGNDTVQVGGQHDYIQLGNGNSIISGTQGMAFISTGSGNDTIKLGGSGTVVTAGAGNNIIAGGTGYDRFVLPQASHGFDAITGFSETNGDLLDLRQSLGATSWNHQGSTLGNFLKVTDSGSNATLSVASSGVGGGTAVAALNGSGNLHLADLLSHHSLLTG